MSTTCASQQTRWRAGSGWLLLALALLLGGCAISEKHPGPLVLGAPSNPALESYKVSLAKYITRVDARMITPGRPQALLRSVVTLEYAVDRRGYLTGVRLFRDNGDRAADATALMSLRRASPFPAPSRTLLDSSGHVHIVETWLFNNDGRFQLRSVAAAQIGDE